MKKYGFVKLVLGVMAATSAVTVSTPSFSLDREVDLEFRRVEQRIARIMQTNKQLLQDVRQLQRENGDLRKRIESFEGKYDEVNDAVTKFENIDLANIRAGQKGLYDQISLFTWGEDTEDCDDIKTKHQQVNSVKSVDGSKTMRYLCFDGKALHIGTEYHGVPQ